MIDSSPNRIDTTDAALAGSRRAYALVLLLVTAFILYGSLFPFEYRPRVYPGGPVAYLLSTWAEWDRRGDLLSNILLYLPFGFFATCTLPPRLTARQRASIALMAGLALSCCVETAQFHDASRVTSLGDVYANGIGTGLGAIVAASVGTSMRWPLTRELAGNPTATILLVMFLAYRLYPYVPTIDLHKYWHAVRPMLTTFDLPPVEAARYVTTWLFIAAIIQTLYGYRRFLWLFPLLCGGEFLGKILIVDNALKLTDVGGGIIAYLLWACVLGGLPGQFAIVAIALAGTIVLQRLEPFRFSTTSHDFGWLPFASFMRGSIGVAIQAFCEKFYEYGGLIWLLGRAGVALPIGTATVAALLFVTSYAECWLPGRSAQITDAVMAGVIGGAFMLLVPMPRGGAGADPPSTAAAREHARLAEAVLAQHGVEVPSTRRRRGRKYAPYVPPRLRG